jgi:glycosyltransferase involved in cell wall biosynthesis
MYMLIPSKLSKNILTVGPDHHEHRGGIGAVIETYNSFFEAFKFIPTFKPFESNFRKIPYFFNQLFKIIICLIKDKDIKIVHIHGSHGASLYRKFIVFLLCKFCFGKKVIYHIHSSSYDVLYRQSKGLQRYIITKFVNTADLIICLSPSWHQFFTTNFSPKQIIIINNVVNKPLNNRGLNLPDSNVNFLFLGRIGDRKGIFDLLKMLADNVDYYQGKIKLTIGGDGEIERLKAFIDENNLHQLVEYAGWVSSDKKHALLSNTQVYILPSYNEGLPISILEAMSYGLPILSTNVGGTPEVVENEVNGFVFEPGDIAAMGKGIDSLLLNPQKILKFSKCSLIKVEPYLPQTVAKQLIACYQSLLSL